MPDRQFVADNPYKGMVILYRRGLTNWSMMIEKVTPNYVYYLWEINVATLEHANRLTTWRSSPKMHKDKWANWILSSRPGYGADYIKVLDAKVGKPQWEV